MKQFQQSGQNEMRPVPNQNRQRTPRHQGLADWFWWLLEQAVQLRGCHISASHAREEAILKQLQQRGFNALYAPAAEQWILYGNWPTTKILRVGLELADFYPDSITVTREELERIQRRIYATAREHVHEVVSQKSSVVPSEKQPLIDQYKQVVEDLNRALIETQQERNSAQSKQQDMIREIDLLKRKENRLLQQCVSLSNRNEILEKTVARLESENERLKNAVNDLFSQENPSENTEKTPKTGEFWDILDNDLLENTPPDHAE